MGYQHQIATGQIPLRRAIATELAKLMRCNCDLDRWEPERSTGHSHVCRIHKAARDYAGPNGATGVADVPVDPVRIRELADTYAEDE